MPSNKKDMSQSDMLAAISEAIKRKQAGEDPELDPGVNQYLPNKGQKEFAAPNITPSKPDPERQINKLMAERMNNGINPETGMPFYSAPEAQPELSPEQRSMLEMKTRMLQDMAKSGQMPGQLKR